MEADPLEQMAGRVAHGVLQLRRCMALLKSGVDRQLGDAQTADTVKTALFESVLVHARKLEDFLALSRTRNSQVGDVYATDFDARWLPRQVLSDRDRQAASDPAGADIDPFVALLKAFGEFLDGLGAREPTRRTWFRMETTDLYPLAG